MELVNDRRIVTAVMSPAVAAAECQQGIEEDISDNLKARDNETWRLHLGCRPSSAKCDDTRARRNVGSKAKNGSRGKQHDRLGVFTPAGQFTSDYSSCAADVWQTYRFATRRWADDEDMTTDGDACPPSSSLPSMTCQEKNKRWADLEDEFSDGDTLDGDTDCCEAGPSSCSSISTSPCTTCAGDVSDCDEEPTCSEADVAEYDYDGFGFGDEYRITVPLPAGLYDVASRSFHLTLAQRFVENMSAQGVVPTSVLDRVFYLALLRTLRVLERHCVERIEMEASLAYASVYLQSARGLSALSQRDIIYRTVLSVCLAFSYISDEFISMGKWKQGLSKDVEAVAEKSVSEMSDDQMKIFKERGYLLRPNNGELEACGVAEWIV